MYETVERGTERAAFLEVMDGWRARSSAAATRAFANCSGRIIALCRLVLSAVFLLALVMDPYQRVRASELGYILLAGYVGLAALLLAAVWRDWWADQRLALPVLALDVFVFLAAVFLTEGAGSDFTSPFLAFFAYLLLAASIRWGWQATVATGAAVTLLYLGVGVFMAAEGIAFDVYRFGRRVAYMPVLALVMVWFSLQRRERRVERFSEPPMAETGGHQPLHAALDYAVRNTQARRAVIAWAEFEEPRTRVLAFGDVHVPPTLGPGEFSPEAGFGRTARIGYSSSIFGTLNGRVTSISPDAVVNEKTGESFYTVEVQTTNNLKDEQGKKLLIGPGMVANVSLLGEKRSILSYLFTPITRLSERAFRE